MHKSVWIFSFGVYDSKSWLPIMLETFLLIFASLILSQNSTLWMSVLLVPFSFLLMLNMNNFFFSGGLTAFIFILMFVGGLLILLVLVTSTAPQEESGMMLPVLLVPLMALLLEKNTVPSTESILLSESLLSYLFNKMFIISAIMVIAVALSVISVFFLKYKGLMRSL